MISRRDFLRNTAVVSAGFPLSGLLADPQHSGVIKNKKSRNDQQGAQRLSLEKLHQWESLEYGMFIHFGMSTFDGDEYSRGNKPSSIYNPASLDVYQWIRVAREAGMKYAVLTTKHVAGHCLWPTKYTGYNIQSSGNKTDVAGAFINACHKYDILPGFYYCSWDNHNLFGSKTPTITGWEKAYTTREYREFQMKQVEELIINYGPLMEMWIDIPGVLGPDGRREQYDQIARLSPDTVIMMNSGLSDGTEMKYNYAWPTDLMAIERWLPSSNRGYNPWFTISEIAGEPKEYYISGEVCDPVGYDWFYQDNDTLRSDGELLGMRLICKARKVNLLLDVPPDRTGVIPDKTVDALLRLRKNYENTNH